MAALSFCMTDLSSAIVLEARTLRMNCFTGNCQRVPRIHKLVHLRELIFGRQRSLVKVTLISRSPRSHDQKLVSHASASSCGGAVIEVGVSDQQINRSTCFFLEYGAKLSIYPADGNWEKKAAKPLPAADGSGL